MKSFLVILAMFGMTAAWVRQMENKGMYQGDILLDPDEDERDQNNNQFASIRGGRWPYARVPYVFDSRLGSYAQYAIKQAIKDLQAFTCLRFSPRKSESVYIHFFEGDGCYSPVGYRRGRINYVSLGYGCWTKSTAIHEIGHSIGLHHEQNRPDRDSFIQINWNKINRNMAHNFNKQSNINSLGTSYDYYSVMHYDQYAFGTYRGAITMVTKNPNMQHIIGKAPGLSKTDVIQINRMYCK